MYMAFSHGSNDTQKTMGVITMSLAAYYGWTGENWGVPYLGDHRSGDGDGSRNGLRRLADHQDDGPQDRRPEADSRLRRRDDRRDDHRAGNPVGIPISTSHVISSTILGVGATGNRRAVRWGVAGNSVTAWIVTIPAFIAMGWLFSTVLHALIP